MARPRGADKAVAPRQDVPRGAERAAVPRRALLWEPERWRGCCWWVLGLGRGVGGTLSGRGRCLRAGAPLLLPACGEWHLATASSQIPPFDGGGWGRKSSSKSCVEEPCGFFYPPFPQETLVTSLNFFFFRVA